MRASRLKHHFESIVLEDLLLLSPVARLCQLSRLTSITWNQHSKQVFSEQSGFVKLVIQCFLETQQRPRQTRARKSIAFFDVKQKDLVGIESELHGNRMFTCLEKLILFGINGKASYVLENSETAFSPALDKRFDNAFLPLLEVEGSQQAHRFKRINAEKLSSTQTQLRSKSKRIQYQQRFEKKVDSFVLFAQNNSLFGVETKKFQAMLSSLPGFSIRLQFSKQIETINQFPDKRSNQKQEISNSRLFFSLFGIAG